MDQAILFWMIACVVFTLLEAFTQQFVSIWFLSGSIVALILSIFNVSIDIQGSVFVIVSLITLIAFRPLVKRLVKGDKVVTNSESNIGELAIVLSDFDELTFEGRILVKDMDWAAKSEEGIAYKKGEKVIVERIEGVKCLVKGTRR